jgi:hypothetical protein
MMHLAVENGGLIYRYTEGAVKRQLGPAAATGYQPKQRAPKLQIYVQNLILKKFPLFRRKAL